MKQKVKYGRDLCGNLTNNEDVAGCCAWGSSREFKSPSGLTHAGSSKMNLTLEESRSTLMERSMIDKCEVPCTNTVNLTLKLKVHNVSSLEEDGQVSENTTCLYERKGSKIEDLNMSNDLCVDSTKPTCQIEGCTADLTSISSYFRRNRVCQTHFKVFEVVVGDHKQRFCHQCNRFHSLSEFDEDRRSCKQSLGRKRSQPEVTSVLPSGTLVYLPGKSRKDENVGLVDASTDEETMEEERTSSNEETMEEETSHNMETYSKTVTTENAGHTRDTLLENAQKERRGTMRGDIDPMAMPSSYIESSGNIILEKILKAEVKMEGSPPTSKNIESKKRAYGGSNVNVCQVEGCMFDLSTTKEYFRRHKVCEGHFKATMVLVKDVEQRFCQQCSRFHVLTEFDEGRKSCKRMLMGHNMRRRKALVSNLNPTKGRTRE